MSERAFYEKHYREMRSSVRQYRQISAAVKAANIMSMARDTRITPLRYIVVVGCGTGDVLRHLVSKSVAELYYAVDISWECLRGLKARPELSNVVTLLYDGRRLPFPDRCFDLAVLSHVVEHIREPVPVILEAARVSRYVMIEVPLEDNLYTRLKVALFRRDYRREIGHVQLFSMRSLRHLLERGCGLRIIAMRLVPVPSWLYYVRKRTSLGAVVSVQVMLRRMLQHCPESIYTRLLTDHCIAVACSDEGTL